MPDLLRNRVLNFFRKVNRTATSAANPHAALGHTYFQNISGVPDLIRLWDHQLRFHFEQAYRLDNTGFEVVRNDWNRVIEVLPEELLSRVETEAAPAAEAAESQAQPSP